MLPPENHFTTFDLFLTQKKYFLETLFFGVITSEESDSYRTQQRYFVRVFKNPKNPYY